MICFYHSADLDGHCSGAIVKYAFPDCELHGIDYGQPFPWHLLDEGNHKEVWMVDFSLQPFSDMVKLNSMCLLTWIDHHKSAIEEYRVACNDAQGVMFKAVLDSNFAACELVWDHISTFSMLSGRAVHLTRLPIPHAVMLLGRYDIWKHEETPGSLEFQYGMRGLAETDPAKRMDLWVNLFKDDEGSAEFGQSLIASGRDILNYERNVNAKFMEAYGFEVEFDGLRCIAANRGMSNSLLFESRWNPEKHDAMLMFAYKGGQWTVSLYSTKPDIDVSVVCKARGGGGHKGAAGFQCKTLPFIAKMVAP